MLAKSGDWQVTLDDWFEPFLDALYHKARRRWAPLYLHGLLSPGGRKNVEAIAERVAPDALQQLHHFVSTSKWSVESLEKVLVKKANELISGRSAILAISDTTLPKQGRYSVGVAKQYCEYSGKYENCQLLVSLMLVAKGISIPAGLRLYLTEEWCSDDERRQRAGVPPSLNYLPKWRIALDRLDRLCSANARFSLVIAGSDYISIPEFRRGLAKRDLKFVAKVPGEMVLGGEQLYNARDFNIYLREKRREIYKESIRMHGRSAHSYGEAAWVLMRQDEHHLGDREFYITNHPLDTEDVVHDVINVTNNAHRSCKKTYQQLKQELGLGHYEGRGWLGLHHHLVLVQIAFTFLQHLKMSRYSVV